MRGSSTTIDLPLSERLRAVLAWWDTRALCFIFLVTQFCDVVTTQQALASQRFQEGNPWLGAVTDAHPLLVFGAKLICAMAVLTGLLLLRLRWRLRLAVLSLFTLASLIAPVTNLMRIEGWL